MAGAAAAGAAATAAASTGLSIARSIFGFLTSNKLVSMGTLAALGYGLHTWMADKNGRSWLGDKTSELFNMAVEKGKGVGERGFDFLWGKAKEHPVIAGLIAVGGVAAATGTMDKLLVPALVAGALYMGYKYMVQGSFNANAEGDPATPQASYKQKLTHKLEIPFIQMRGLAVAGVPSLDHE